MDSKGVSDAQSSSPSWSVSLVAEYIPTVRMARGAADPLLGGSQPLGLARATTKRTQRCLLRPGSGFGSIAKPTRASVRRSGSPICSLTSFAFSVQAAVYAGSDGGLRKVTAICRSLLECQTRRMLLIRVGGETLMLQVLAPHSDRCHSFILRNVSTLRLSDMARHSIR